MTWSTLPQALVHLNVFFGKTSSSPPRPFQNSDGLLLLCMSSLSVLDINPLLRRMVCASSFPCPGVAFSSGWFPLLEALSLGRHPCVDFCPVPSVDALEESQRTSQPPSPKACPSAAHLSLLAPLVCGSMHVPFLRSSLGVGHFTHCGLPPLPVWLPHWLHADVSLLSEPLPLVCVPLTLPGLLTSGICRPLQRLPPPPARVSYPSHVHFQGLCFTLALVFLKNEVLKRSCCFTVISR